jgi:HlyD family secretion protein
MAEAVITETRREKRKKKVDPKLLVLLGIVVLFAAYFLFFRKKETTTTTVRYSAAQVGDISKGITATGTLQATTTVQVGSQVSGTIRELYADFNSRVQKGQLLARLDPTFYDAALTQAKANLSKAQADYETALKDEHRQAELLKRELIAQADYDVSKNKLLDARATITQQQALVKQAETNLSYTVIKSPISGVVVSRNVDKGQTVAASLNAPTLFLIAQDLSSMQVAANVDEADIGQVIEGQTVRYTVDAYPGQEFDGTVQQIRINPVTTQNVVTYTVIILTANPGGKLLPGMTATVSIVSASRDNVLKIPSAALRFVPPEELGGPDSAQRAKSQAMRAQYQNRSGQGSGQSGHAANQSGGGSGYAGARSGGIRGDSTHTMAQAGDSTHKAWQMRSPERTIYVKPASGTKLQAVKVVPGLSDGSWTEVLSSNPALHAGDSIAVGAFSAGAAGAPAAPQGTSPVGGMRGFGGGGRGGGR